MGPSPNLRPGDKAEAPPKRGLAPSHRSAWGDTQSVPEPPRPGTVPRSHHTSSALHSPINMDRVAADLRLRAPAAARWGRLPGPDGCAAPAVAACPLPWTGGLIGFQDDKIGSRCSGVTKTSSGSPTFPTSPCAPLTVRPPTRLSPRLNRPSRHGGTRLAPRVDQSRDRPAGPPWPERPRHSASMRSATWFGSGVLRGRARTRRVASG